jgi:hypothetical protein
MTVSPANAREPHGNGVGFSISSQRAQRGVHLKVFAAEPFGAVSAFSNLVDYPCDSRGQRRGRFTDALQPGALRAGDAPGNADRRYQAHAQAAVDSHAGRGLGTEQPHDRDHTLRQRGSGLTRGLDRV